MRTLYAGLRRVVQTIVEPKTRALYDLADKSPKTPSTPNATQERYRLVENVAPDALRESLARNAAPKQSRRKTLNAYLGARFDYRLALALFAFFCLFALNKSVHRFYLDYLKPGDSLGNMLAARAELDDAVETYDADLRRARLEHFVDGTEKTEKKLDQAKERRDAAFSRALDKVDYSKAERLRQLPWYHHAVAWTTLAAFGLGALAAGCALFRALRTPLIKLE